MRRSVGDISQALHSEGILKPAPAPNENASADNTWPEHPERYPGQMATQADRAAERRVAKLEDVERQLKEGSLTIRKMTAAERKRYPPRPAKPRKTGRR